jgi:molybdopterin-guanine dinucleotide biosynthesis protein
MTNDAFARSPTDVLLVIGFRPREPIIIVVASSAASVYENDAR